MTLSVRLQRQHPGFRLDVDFAAPPGVTVLFGRSGAGKTSVISAVAGLDAGVSGRVAVGDWVLLDSARRVALPPHRRRIGYVFQEDRLFPHLSVRQNLGYGRWFAPRDAEGVSFERVVGMLGIGALLDRRPAGLSGGERQRVAIGRALLSRPRLLLMDEPLAALDEARKAEILPYLERLRDETAVPVLYVTHSVAELARLATTVVLIEAGRVRRAGPVVEVLADPSLGQLLAGRDAGAVLQARIAGQEPDGLTRLDTAAGPLWLPAIPGVPGQAEPIRIAAQDVMIALERPAGLSALNVLPAVVTALAPDPGGVTVQLRAGEALLLARVTLRSATALGLAPGVPCHAILKSVALARGGPLRSA